MILITLITLCIPGLGQQNTASYWNDNGVNLSKAGQYDAALAAFDKAHRAEPIIRSSLEQQGHCALRIRLPGESKDAVTTAMNLGYTALPHERIHAAVV
jgi:tetratricopeptide (TPR) repeat protein